MGSGASAVAIPQWSRPGTRTSRQRSAATPPSVAPSQPAAAAVPPRSRPGSAAETPWIRCTNGGTQKPMP